MMRRKHILTVQPRKVERGSAGQKEFVPDGAPVQVRVNMRPLSTEEIVLWGDSARDLRKVFCDTWPGNMDALITGRGASWDQVAPEQVYDYGSSTQHVELVLRKR